MLNAFTVDVEDYFHVTAFDRIVHRSDWDTFPSRVVENTRRILRLLEKHQVHATFFVLGWVGHKFPQLVREIADAGHEIGCHSYWHRLIYHLTPQQFQDDLRRARTVLEDASGREVVSFRGPTWSITTQSLWALDTLLAEGFRYDSSIFPIHHDRYGIPSAQPFLHYIRRDGSGLWEFPPSIVRLAKINLPVSGGGYFRLYPRSWSAHAIRLVNSRYGRPFMFYIHPWEIDAHQPRLKAGYLTSWRHYVNLASTEAKLDWLLSRFAFGTVTESVAQAPCVDTASGTSRP